MNKKIRAVLPAILIALCIVWGGASESFAKQRSHVTDEAELLTEEEEKQINQAILAFSELTGMDAVVVTVNDDQGLGAREFADRFYETGDYGEGEQKSGFLYLLDMAEREAYISTTGGAVTLFSDRVIEELLDEAYESLSEEDFAGSALAVINGGAARYREAIQAGWVYEADSGIWNGDGVIRPEKSVSPAEALISALIAALVSLWIGNGVKRRYRMQDGKTVAILSSAGLLAASGSAFAFSGAADELLHSHTVRRMLPPPVLKSFGSGGSTPFGPSSTHHSSGGGVHGGGGRKF